MESLRVGAGRREIMIPKEFLATENFRTIHDPIHARAIVIKAEGNLFALVSLELTSIPEDEVQAIKKLIFKKAGIPKENIWVCVTHSFSSPHLLPDFILKTQENIELKALYRSEIQEAVLGAVADGLGCMRPAKAGVGTGISDIVANRDIMLEDGWWIGTGGAGMTNQTVTVICFRDMKGRIITVLSHFAIQSSVMDQSELSTGGKPVTSDIAGNACAMVEEALGDGAVAMFLIGAAGDQAPVEKSVNEVFRSGKRTRIDLHEQGFEICERLSKRLSDVILEAVRKTPCDMTAGGVCMRKSQVMIPTKRMDQDIHSLLPTHSFQYIPDGEKEFSLEAMLLGDVAFLGVQPELNCVTAKEIMEKSEFDTTLICTMVNGSSKYMADKDSFDRFTYEAMNSPWDRGAAEILAKEGIKLLAGLRN